MFKIGMTIADMDRVFIGKRNTTGYDNIEIVQSLSYNELQYYDKIFKQEQGVHGELSDPRGRFCWLICRERLTS